MTAYATNKTHNFDHTEALHKHATCIHRNIQYESTLTSARRALFPKIFACGSERGTVSYRIEMSRGVNLPVQLWGVLTAPYISDLQGATVMLV